MRFPLWFLLEAGVVYFWFVSIPVLGILLYFGCNTSLAWGWRLAAFAVAALLTLAFVDFGVQRINE